MEFNFKKKILGNGMTILFEKRKLPLVSVAFAVRNGGINESLSEKGISHFIEHMLYKGTKTRTSKKIAEEIEKNGGVLNGFTSELTTAYWCKIPSIYLKTALDVLSDMIKNSVFEEKEFEKERKVIFEEIKMRRDTPRVHVFDEVQKCLYDGTMAIDSIGTYEIMNSITQEKIINKFKQIYKPNNMILCVVGDADFNEIVDFVENNFNNEKGIVPTQKFNLKNDFKIEKRKGIDQANLVFAYHVPISGDKKHYAAEVLNILMAGGMSSRLFSEIREKRNLAYSIHGGSDINKDFAYSFVYAGITKENMDLVKELILKEFEKVSENLDEFELAQVKKQIIGNYHLEMEDSQTQMMNLLFSEIDGDAKEFYEYEKNIMDVKLGDVKELAKKAKEKYSFFALIPEE